MTYLELCQQLRQDCGVSGTGPLSVTNQTGENKRLVDWIKNAWLELQLSKREWLFLRGSFSFTTTIAKQSYTPTEAGITTRFRNWETNSMRMGKTALGDRDEICLPHIPYETFRAIYLTGNQSLGRPLEFTTAPQLDIALGHIPDDVYTVRGEYYKKPQMLSQNGDIPDMPEEYHSLIVYKAMEKYALFESAPEVLQNAKMFGEPMLSALMTDQLPQFQSAEALLC
jgi:hypothetical protein